MGTINEHLVDAQRKRPDFANQRNRTKYQQQQQQDDDDDDQRFHDQARDPRPDRRGPRVRLLRPGLRAGRPAAQGPPHERERARECVGQELEQGRTLERESERLLEEREEQGPYQDQGKGIQGESQGGQEEVQEQERKLEKLG